MSSRNRILSQREVEGMIADGRILVIHQGYVLKLDGWLDKHPGGRLAILHMVGRDATNEINVYHFDKTIKLMKAYRIGRINHQWVNREPPLRGGVFLKNAKQESDFTSESEHSDADGGLSSTSSVSLSASISTSTSISTSISARSPSKPSPSVADVSSTNGFVKGDAAVPRECIRRTPFSASSPPSASSGVAPQNLTRAAFTASKEQEEIARDIIAYPSVDAETQRAIVSEYQALHQRVHDEGFYKCHYSNYGKDAIRWACLFAVFVYFLRAKWYLTSAAFLGMFWQQIMFTAHDAGHRAITGNFVVDTIIGAFIADFCCGLSIGWWKSSHNVHHLITNMPEHDPDLQNVPLFATSPTYFKSITSTFYNFAFIWDAAADAIVPYQKYTYYPVMFLARFNLYILSWLHLLSPRSMNLGSAWWTRHVEIVFMACYWAMFGYGLVWLTLPDWPTRIAFVILSHGFTMILHVQITLSHWGTPTSDLGPTESFPQRQLRTTMDVDCPEWLDWFHGGLQFQAIHHLFPRVPRHNLRRLQPLVRDFCAKTRIQYRCHAFVDGNKVVLGRLDEVAKMVDTLVQCQKHMAETGESGLH